MKDPPDRQPLRAPPGPCLHMPLTVKRKLHDCLKESALIGGIAFPGCIAAGSSVPVAQIMRNLQVREGRRAAVIARNGIVICYRRQEVARWQVRIDWKTATMANPAVALTHLYPVSLMCIAARTYVTARRADEPAPLVAILTPVHLCAALQAAHGRV